MTARQAVAFVKQHGVVLESARGTVPSLAEAIAGEPIHGSWWGHAQGNLIHTLTCAVRDDADVLVCRLISGKVTFVHRRLWPALARVAPMLDEKSLVVIREEHTPSGAHRLVSTPFARWLPPRRPHRGAAALGGGGGRAARRLDRSRTGPAREKGSSCRLNSLPKKN